MSLEAQLHSLEALAPRLGLVADEVRGLVAQGRAGDLAGARQRARRVCEGLVRQVLAVDRTPAPAEGLADLDVLLAMLRQPAFAGVVPAHVLAHLGAVQAWGGQRDDAGATFTSMAAVLLWSSQPARRIPLFTAPTPPPSAPPPVPALTPLPVAGASAGLAGALDATAAPSRTPAPAAAANATPAFAPWRTPAPAGAAALEHTFTPPRTAVPAEALERTFASPSTPARGSGSPIPAEALERTFASPSTPARGSGSPIPAELLERTFGSIQTPAPVAAASPAPAPADAFGSLQPPASVALGSPVPAPDLVAAPRRARVTRWVGAAVALALAAAAAVWLRPSRPPVAEPGALDALYAGWGEPLPPAACRGPAERAVLTPIARQAAALSALPADRSAEAWYLLARARFDLGEPAGEPLRHAVQCPGFAGANELLGRVLAVESDQHPEQAAALREQALAMFELALAASPDFHRARQHRAAVLLKVAGRLDDAVADLRAVTLADQDNGQAHLLLGFALDRQAAAEQKVAEALAQVDEPAAAQKRAVFIQLGAESKRASCRALELGLAEAAARCRRTGP